ncbi:unnamed protein product [Brassica napus]|uniref:(rape) hypothetical protein n=1 Tax=Brassica napus TaxID=3708 RepID=A0A816X095_BRANA|nr:unnamed protein product [Brassica napus]
MSYIYFLKTHKLSALVDIPSLPKPQQTDLGSIGASAGSQWKEWIKRGEVELSCRVIEIGGVWILNRLESLRLAFDDEKVEDEGEEETRGETLGVLQDGPP